MKIFREVHLQKGEGLLDTRLPSSHTRQWLLLILARVFACSHTQHRVKAIAPLLRRFHDRHRCDCLLASVMACRGVGRRVIPWGLENCLKGLGVTKR